MKRVTIGSDLERLQAELAELRRRAEVYPRSEAAVTPAGKRETG